MITCGMKDQTRKWKAKIESGGKDFDVEGLGSVYRAAMWLEGDAAAVPVISRTH